MKIITIILTFIISITIFSQNNEDKIRSIKNYADSIDNVMIHSEGIPGELFCNTVTIKRNERAIGLQETKISFYFLQKEDSVIDDGNEVHFIPVYTPPLKILIEYNIAASQNVSISYYFYNKFIYYCFKSTGDFGYDERKFVLTKSTLKYYAKYNSESKNPVAEKYKDFSSEENLQSGKIYSNSVDYEKLYFQTFYAGQLDK